MAIETLDDWNEKLAACGCCPMPECPAPSLQSQYVYRTLCAMTASPSEYHIGNPSPNFNPANSGVPFKEASIAYRKMTVNDSSGYNDETGSASSEVDVTVIKNPETAEDNKVGIPAYYCSKTRVDGTWSSEYTTKDGEGNVTATGSESGTFDNEVATPFGASSGTGTYTWQTFDEDGNLTDSGSGEAAQSYGPAWYGIWGGSWWNVPESITTTVETAGLKHEVTGYGRTLVVQFLDPHTKETAFAAITTPDPAPTDWSGSALSTIIASFIVGRADEANDDMRVTGAAHMIGRYRWRIPFSHKGTKFKLWWDEGFFSKEWLAWKVKDDAYKAWEKAHAEWEQSQEDPKPPEPPEPEEPGEEPAKPTLTPKSYVWTGPGNATDANHASWFTPYSTTVKVPAATEGRIEPCNVRFAGYESKFGTKPQIHDGFRIYNPDDT